MKMKLDENVDLRILARLRLAGHDAATVPEQKLMSAPDTTVIEVCRQEARCLVTADRDFSNRGRYNPAAYAGIAVIRLPPLVRLSDWQVAIDAFMLGLESADITGKLWVIRGSNIQEYQPIPLEERDDE